MQRIEEAAIYLFGRNWRTTTSAIVTVLAGFIALNPQIVNNDTITKIAEYISLGGLSALGINATDKQSVNRR